MSDLREMLNTVGEADKAKSVDLVTLTALVEAQIDDVLGGGYSQYGGYHGKSVLN